MQLPQKYIMVDYENVQPKDLEAFDNPLIKILVFVGETQKTPAGWEEKSGERFEVIRISGNGKNAVDFHIPYYIGVLSVSDPRACFQIISKDKGFDAVLRHVSARGTTASRKPKLCPPKTKPLPLAKPLPLDPELESVVRKLRNFGTSRPKTITKLINTIISWNQRRMDEAHARKLVARLEKTRCLSVSANKVTYVLQ